jgi:hypothetical protein
MGWKLTARQRAIWDVFSTVCLSMMLGLFTGGRVDSPKDEVYGLNGTQKNPDYPYPYDLSDDVDKYGNPIFR